MRLTYLATTTLALLACVGIVGGYTPAGYTVVDDGRLEGVVGGVCYQGNTTTGGCNGPPTACIQQNPPNGYYTYTADQSVSTAYCSVNQGTAASCTTQSPQYCSIDYSCYYSGCYWCWNVGGTQVDTVAYAPGQCDAGG